MDRKYLSIILAGMLVASNGFLLSTYAEEVSDQSDFEMEEMMDSDNYEESINEDSDRIGFDENDFDQSIMDNYDSDEYDENEYEEYVVEDDYSIDFRENDGSIPQNAADEQDAWVIVDNIENTDENEEIAFDMNEKEGDYSYVLTDDGVKILKYLGIDKNVAVPSNIAGYPVTAIGDYAFADCDFVETLTIPDTVSNLGSYFIKGTSITDIEIPNSIISCNYECINGEINGPLAGAGLLKSVKFEPGINCIPEYICAMADNSISEIFIPDGVSEIGVYSFYNCTSITEMNLPGSVKKIGAYAFYGCVNLEHLHFGDMSDEIADKFLEILIK